MTQSQKYLAGITATTPNWISSLLVGLGFILSILTVGLAFLFAYTIFFDITQFRRSLNLYRYLKLNKLKLIRDGKGEKDLCKEYEISNDLYLLVWNKAEREVIDKYFGIKYGSSPYSVHGKTSNFILTATRLCYITRFLTKKTSKVISTFDTEVTNNG
jgi:hypothetical protein